MKIRTRLLFSLLPTLSIGLSLILVLICFAPQILSPYIFLAIASIALMISSTFLSLHLMAGKITRPIKKLNASALNIAAGQYGESIELKGPKELGELANTLNTMSECLLEHINSLKENALQQENAYGETACARLLQQHLLQKSIDECASDALAIKAISFSSASPKGFLLNYPKQAKPEHFVLQLAEAEEDGINGMYELLIHHKLAKEISGKTLSLVLNRETATLCSKASNFPSPIFWSYGNEQLSFLTEDPQPIQPGDFVFLMNPAFLTIFKTPAGISQLFIKVLNVFSDEGLETCASMLQKEISFHAKRRDLDDDLHLICIQILNHSA